MARAVFAAAVDLQMRMRQIDRRARGYAQKRQDLELWLFPNDQTADRFTLQGGKRSTMRLPEYQAWQALLHRNSSELICANWCLPNGEGFSNFFRDIGKRPTPKHRLVRVNAKEPFSPANCLWSDQIPRRGVPRRSIRISNVEMTLREAAAQFGVPYAVLCRRLQRGWCAERAVQPLVVA